MVILTIDEYNTRFPKTNDVYFNSLTEYDKNYYLKLQALYYNLTLQYFLDVFNIKKYDENFESSSLNYEKISKDKMDIYQYQSSEFLNYIYLRNNIYVERLNELELNFLENRLENNLINLDDEVIDFLNKTVMKVIVEEVDKKKEKLINYGPDNDLYLKPNNGIIFGFRYNQFDQSEKQSDAEWKSIHFKRLNDIYHNLGYFELEMLDDRKSIPHGIIEYNELSVKKR